MNVQRGFTIIESVLVLAITGLVIAVVLVGIGTSLRAERYRDATSQTLDYFQGLYDSTANISNDRPATDACTSAGIVSTGGEGRGTSSCLLMGYTVRSSNGAAITRKQVIARIDASKIAGEDQKTEKQTLLDSSMDESSASATTYNLEWGVALQYLGNPATFSMLVVRTPLTGVLKTYISTSSATTPITTLLSSPVPSGGVSFCIDPSGIFDAGTQKNGLIIDENATNSSSIRQLAAGSC